MGGLQAPEIEKRDEWAPDPYVEDLLQFDQPGGLDITAATSNPLAIDPMVQDLFEYDRPAGLGMPGPMTPDPTLPDLQEPELEQEIHMQDRPGDLAGDALDAMHDDPTYKQIPTRNSKELWMQQKDTRHRTKHMGMLTAGLDSEERD
jgi:hypothetical protein